MRPGWSRTWGRAEMEAVLACPHCRGGLDVELQEEGPGGWETGAATCRSCEGSFRLNGGVWDLRGPTASRVGQGGRRWAAEDFDHLQPGDREYQSHAEWLQLKLGFGPRAARVLSSYQEPFRKGRLRDWLQEEEWEILLDVGCGVGYFLFDLADAAPGGRLLLGVDVSPQVLATLASRRGREGQKRILAVRGDAEHLPIRDGTAGAVTSSEVLEHVANPDQAMAEMGRVSTPGSVVVGTTPNARGEAVRERIARWAERLRLIRRGRDSQIYWQELYDVPVHDTWLADSLDRHGLRLENLLYAHRVPGAARIARSLPVGVTARVLKTVERLLPGRTMGMIMVFRARRSE